MSISHERRSFLKTIARVSGVMGVQAGLRLPWPAWMPRLAFSPIQNAPRGDTLLVVFLRGAADGLNIIVPHGEESYYRRRPTLGIPRPDDRNVNPTERVLDLDGFFGLHPACAPLMPLWQAGHLVPIHACGAPDDSRSHFKAMELMERGVSNMHGPASGWISRHLASLDTGNPSPLRAIGLGETVPRMLRGQVPVSALRSIADFHLGGDVQAAFRMQSALKTLYAGQEPLDLAGQETLGILETLNKLDPETYVPRPSAHYPETDFGFALRQVSMLEKADVGLEVAAIDLGGWDTHFAQGGSAGLMANLLTDLTTGLQALYSDLESQIGQLTVVVMTEFGRRVGENASLGTDHGHGGVMLLLGGNLTSQRVHTHWPGLEEESLFGPGDLHVTIDYRDVLAELCLRRLNNPNLPEIFPDYQAEFQDLFVSF